VLLFHLAVIPVTLASWIFDNDFLNCANHFATDIANSQMPLGLFARMGKCYVDVFFGVQTTSSNPVVFSHLFFTKVRKWQL
jgi:hypothetical protein